MHSTLSSILVILNGDLGIFLQGLPTAGQVGGERGQLLSVEVQQFLIVGCEQRQVTRALTTKSGDPVYRSGELHNFAQSSGKVRDEQ